MALATMILAKVVTAVRCLSGTACTPDRAWAERLQPCAFTAEELEQRVREYLNDALL